MQTHSLVAGLLLAAASLSPAFAPTAAASPTPGLMAVGTVITGRAGSGALYTLDDGYGAAANPVSAALSDGFGDIEFLSDDFNLFFDFQSDGSLSIYGLADGLHNSFSFDLAGLPGRLARAELDHPVAGLRFDVQGSHTLRVTLDGTTFTADGSPYVAHLVVPEPGAAALAALGLLLLAGLRRSRRA